MASLLNWIVVAFIARMSLTSATPVVTNIYATVHHGFIPTGGITMVAEGLDACSKGQCAGMCTKLGNDCCRGFMFHKITCEDDVVVINTGRCQLILFNSAADVLLSNAGQGAYCDSFYVISSYKADIILGRLCSVKFNSIY